MNVVNIFIATAVKVKRPVTDKKVVKIMIVVIEEDLWWFTDDNLGSNRYLD